MDALIMVFLCPSHGSLRLSSFHSFLFSTVSVPKAAITMN